MFSLVSVCLSVKSGCWSTYERQAGDMHPTEMRSVFQKWELSLLLCELRHHLRYYGTKQETKILYKQLQISADLAAAQIPASW